MPFISWSESKNAYFTIGEATNEIYIFSLHERINGSLMKVKSILTYTDFLSSWTNKLKHTLEILFCSNVEVCLAMFSPLSVSGKFACDLGQQENSDMLIYHLYLKENSLSTLCRHETPK